MPIARALDGNDTLAALLARIDSSCRRWQAARGAVPAALAAQIEPGPLDDDNWSLLAASGAAAAKLRQCLPAIEQTLLEQGHRALKTRVKVRRPQG